MFRSCPSIRLSFLAADGTVPQASGLNWWNSGGRPRDPNEAYIALPKAKLPAAALVLGGTTGGTKFIAIMHDGTVIRMRLEGNRKKGDTEAKQIGSAGNKRVFGQWILRQILRIPANTLVTSAHLTNYGRNDIVFYRIGTHPKTGEAIVYGDFKP